MPNITQAQLVTGAMCRHRQKGEAGSSAFKWTPARITGRNGRGVMLKNVGGTPTVIKNIRDVQPMGEACDELPRVVRALGSPERICLDVDGPVFAGTPEELRSMQKETIEGARIFDPLDIDEEMQRDPRDVDREFQWGTE